MRAILTYHSIDPSGSVISVNARTFARHVAWLAAHSNVVPLERITRLPHEHSAIAITFDDGFKNFADTAWPVLRVHDLPVTLFVVPGHVGGTNQWSVTDGVAVPRLPLADWDVLGRLAEEGVSIGCHTQTHKNLQQLNGAKLYEEIARAAETIADRIGQWPRTFAYPYGAQDKRAVAAVALAHSLACTTELRPLSATDDPLKLPRLDAYYFQAEGLLENFGMPAFMRYLARRRAARSVRAVLRHAARRA